MEGFSTNHGAALLIFLTILSAHVSLSTSSPSAAGFAGDFSPFKPECRGSIAECLATEDVGGELFFDDAAEFEMDSEINRRILAARRYISYGALRRNSIPCSRRGASYYNCRRGAQANPYSRGCSAITRCRR